MKAFQCMRTGIYFPEDYVEMWGIKYGVGLGSVPVSEALVNQYWARKAAGNDGKETYPCGNSFSPIQQVEITQAMYDENKAILAMDDQGMNERGKIMRDRQVKNNRVPA